MSLTAANSKYAAWAMKSAVFGSLFVTGYHFYPALQETTMKNAVTLATDVHSRFAKEGVRRIRRQVRQSEVRRRGLLKYGAISVLSETVAHTDEEVRDISMEALSIFGHGAIRDAKRSKQNGGNERNAARQLLSLPSIATALVGDECGKGCKSLWSVVVGSNGRPDDKRERIEVLKSFQDVDGVVNHEQVI